jgi:ABC-type lipoprotein export system ATPase subunit
VAVTHDRALAERMDRQVELVDGGMVGTKIAKRVNGPARPAD